MAPARQRRRSPSWSAAHAESFGYEEIQVREEGMPPFVATGPAGLTVALDTTLTHELRAEGLCREIINKVQNLRKKSGLEVADRIQLVVTGPADGPGGRGPDARRPDSPARPSPVDLSAARRIDS